MDCEFQQCIRQAGFTEKDTWATVHVFGDHGDILEYHVVPVKDSDGHQGGLCCHCDPDIGYNEQNGVPVVTHNSFDGREALEEARNILNKLQDHGK